MSVTWELTRHAGEVGLARLPGGSPVPRWALSEDAQGPLWSVARSAEELSILCAYEEIPGNLNSVGPYVVFSVDGPLDSSLVGVLAGLLAPLAAADVPVMAQSSYDTDWVLVPVPHAEQAVAAWSHAGHRVDHAEEES